MAKSKPKKVSDVKGDTSFSASVDERITPLLPANLAFENVYRAFWNRKSGPLQFEQARSVAGTSDFLLGVFYLKEVFFNDAFRFLGTSPSPYKVGPDAKLSAWVREQEYPFARVVSDVFQEWLVCDNVVAYWTKNDGKELPPITILDCEVCDYRNAFGKESLKLKVAKVTLGDEEAAGLPPRIANALKKGEDLKLDEGEGDRFKVLTRAKLGKGLGRPRMGGILLQLSTMELLGVADWAGAFQHKKVMRQFKKGHETRYGARNGSSANFIKAADAKAIHAANKGKDGAYDTVTNFDVDVKYPHFPTEFFDTKKYDGTLRRLEAWAGPLAAIMKQGQVNPLLFDLFAQEGRRCREQVGGYLDSIFNHPDFLGKAKPPSPLLCQWNPRSFTSLKMMMELVRLAGGSGYMSPQTARECLDLDDRMEGDLMAAAHGKKKRYTPPFEAKQGMAGNAAPKAGGRPSGSPHPTGGPQEN